MEKQYVLFELGQQDYAIAIEHVNEITEFKTITDVPNAPSHIQGIVDLRGSVIPIIKLSALFKTGSLPIENQKILIVNHDDRNVGMLIDAAKNVMTFDDTQIGPLHSIIRNEGSFIEGTISHHDRLVLLITASKIIESTQNNLSTGESNA